MIDTSRSTRPFGTCQKIAGVMKKQSHWCKKGSILGNPRKPVLKYGRQTVFNGPIGKQKGWCGKILKGSNDAAGVALSTKYINLKSISPHSPYCGKCLCIRVLGHDEKINKSPPRAAKKYYGTIFKGIVMDMCSECEDDHIDILTDRPYSAAPVNKWNPYAKHYNSIRGTRKIPVDLAYGVGVWKTEWNFVPCNTKCELFFR
jgi:hypothetical protein